jgi:hypothetical protein
MFLIGFFVGAACGVVGMFALAWYTSVDDKEWG